SISLGVWWGREGMLRALRLLPRSWVLGADNAHQRDCIIISSTCLPGVSGYKPPTALDSVNPSSSRSLLPHRLRREWWRQSCGAGDGPMDGGYPLRGDHGFCGGGPGPQRLQSTGSKAGGSMNGGVILSFLSGADTLSALKTSSKCLAIIPIQT